MKFQTLESNQRRKDIYQALTANMETLFKFFLWLINKHFTKMQELTAIGSDQSKLEANVHSRVCQVSVEIISLKITLLK